MASVFVFWKRHPSLAMAAEAIAQELQWGEDVEGLIDLPIKEMLDQLKAAFPSHTEKPGQLICRAGQGQIVATWTWQFMRLECTDVEPDEQERAAEIIRNFGCATYDPQIGAELPPA